MSRYTLKRNKEKPRQGIRLIVMENKDGVHNKR